MTNRGAFSFFTDSRRSLFLFPISLNLYYPNMGIQGFETIMNYKIELSEELVDFFSSVFTVLDLKYGNPENMLKSILLEGLEHRLEHFAENQSLDQHARLHSLIDEEKVACLNG